MGYTTDFYGELEFNKPITDELKNYINKFNEVRHMKRDNDKIMKENPDWAKYCYKGDLGIQGEYYVGGTGFAGQGEDESIENYNSPSIMQPGLWCDWHINDNGNLEWDGSEKFYNYEDWLIYLIGNFFEPEGYILNGTISFQGEDSSDRGYIEVTDNEVNLIYDDGNMTIQDYSNAELIAELKRRGFEVA